jgi:hypothetical protein
VALGEFCFSRSGAGSTPPTSVALKEYAFPSISPYTFVHDDRHHAYIP